jgi:O-antigen/teichoic acid export membrane protein
MRGQMFPEIARVTVWQNVARAAAPVCLFPLQGGWVGLVAGEVVGRCAGLGTLIRSNGLALRRALSALAAGDIWRAFRRYPESPTAGMPSALIDTAGTLLPLPLIAGLFGATSAGYFALVQRAMQLPLGLISRNVADVFHARLAQHARASTAAARTLFWRTTLLLLVVGGIPSVLGIFLAPQLLTFFMGSRWAPAGQLLVAMIPWSLAMFVVSPISRAVVVYRGQVFKLLYDGASLAAVGLVIWWAKRADWSLLHTVWVLSWSQAATYLIYFGVLLHMLYREVPEPYTGVGRVIE